MFQFNFEPNCNSDVYNPSRIQGRGIPGGRDGCREEGREEERKGRRKGGRKGGVVKFDTYPCQCHILSLLYLEDTRTKQTSLECINNGYLYAILN